MDTVELNLKPIDGYLLAIKRDTINGWYFMEIGVPVGWVYKGNKYITCDVLKKSENGVMLKISPTENEISIDDLIAFTVLIIDTNSKIVEKQEELNGILIQVKNQLEEQARNYYKELDDLKNLSFQKFDSEDSTSNKPKVIKGKTIQKPNNKVSGKKVLAPTKKIAPTKVNKNIDVLLAKATATIAEEKKIQNDEQ